MHATSNVLLLQDRKAILKSMKTFFANTAVDEHGYLFILALFDAVDDIVFLRKTLIKVRKNSKQIFCQKVTRTYANNGVSAHLLASLREQPAVYLETR